MGNRLIKAGLVATALLLASAIPAQAGVPIPCTGESVVKVRDIPNAPRMSNGQPVALGYLFKGCFSGEWVGHVGSDSQFIRLNEKKLKLLMTIANLKELPPEPSRWEHPGELVVPGVWAIIVAFAIGGGLLNAGKGKAPAPAQAPQPGSRDRRPGRPGQPPQFGR